MFENYFGWLCRSAKKYLTVFAALTLGLCAVFCFLQLSVESAYADEKTGEITTANKFDALPLSVVPALATGNSITPLSDDDKTAFAIYSADDSSLTFYADETVPSNGDKYDGKTVTDVFTGFDSKRFSSNSGQPWKNYRTDIMYVTTDESFSTIQPIGMAYWFYGLENCSEFDLQNIDTSQVNNMSYLFVCCESVRNLDLSSWDTSNVQTMYSMFHQCYSLSSVDLSGFNTSKVTTFGYMFYQCRSLSSVDLGGFDTPKVTYLSSMFYDCSSLSALDLSGFDTSSVTSMASVFQGCTNLKHLNLSGWDTQKVTTYSSLLSGDKNLLDITLDDTFTVFSKSASALSDIQVWYDAKANVVSDNYMIGFVGAGTYYTYAPAQEITEDMFEVDTSDKTYRGESIKPDVTSELVLGTDYIVEYGDNTDAGFGTILITGIGSYEGTLSYEFVITPADATITVDSFTKTYGESDPTFAGTPTGLVHDYDLGTITYTRESGDAVGTYTITAYYTDNPNYNVTVIDGTLTIIAADISEGGFTVTVTDDGDNDFTYNGRDHTPNIVLTDKDGNVLTFGEDYTVNYTNNRDAGIGHIIIEGTGNYEGKITVDFDIAAADVTITCADESKVYGADDPVLSGTVVGLVDGDDLNVVYARQDGESVGTYTITATYTPNDNYNVSVKDAMFSIIAAEITFADISGVDSSYIYTGSAIDPKPVVVVSGITLVEGSDYTLDYGENIYDEGSVTVVGRGNYSGSVEITFEIIQEKPQPIEITPGMFEVDTSYGIYDGSDSVIKSIKSDLVLGTDYTVSYTDNNEPGEATITITGIGDYEGTLEYTFKILHYFEDVGAYITEGNNWYFDAVYDLVDQNVITGYNETTFGVGDPMTRAQLVTIMWRYCEPDEYANYNEATAKNTCGLPDVSDGMYYTGAVNWAVSEGVVTGNQLADGSYVFSPDDNVSFEQMVTIVARYVLGFDGAEKYDTSALTRGAFTDAATVSDYARGSVAWAIEAGVVTGNQNTDGTYTIAPLENVARERAATVLARAIQAGLITAN